MTKKVVILGAGGHARDVLDILEACAEASGGHDVLGFIVEEGYGDIGSVVNGLPILGYLDWLRDRVDDVLVICAIGDPHHRQRIARCLDGMGVRYCNAIHPRASLAARITFGHGISIGAGAVLTSNVCIGNHVQINTGCTINHDVILRDYATISPGVHLAGNVTIETGAYIGIGASVIDKKTIGEWSIIGAGSAIVRDVAPFSTVVGVPGRVIKTRVDQQRDE